MLRFRESFRGYNRDDVNAYIEKININFSKKEAELRAVICDLENKANSASSQVSVDEFEAIKNELQLLKEENIKLKESINTPEQSSDDEKSKLYDSMSAQVGNIIIIANSNAEKIVSDAKAQAEDIVSKARAEASVIVSEAEAKKANAVAYMENELRTVSNECLVSYNALISEANMSFTNISDNVKAKTELIITALNEKTKAIENKLVN